MKKASEEADGEEDYDEEEDDSGRGYPLIDGSDHRYVGWVSATTSTWGCYMNGWLNETFDHVGRYCRSPPIDPRGDMPMPGYKGIERIRCWESGSTRRPNANWKLDQGYNCPFYTTRPTVGITVCLYSGTAVLQGEAVKYLVLPFPEREERKDHHQRQGGLGFIQVFPALKTHEQHGITADAY
ncbi:uncharacterized protein LY79DRAFT_103451 [Colletotrichum navitas]|uniref:Uncharacterized protein n=1 Tax=Colletotrichum navitas TaxID=681940 RepID=A0AAD8PK17_9PEZI|nr:uncharacterized protein LY79DRAFT_103451 [Colletotrichum navitas]KAK1566265.1 hypothetical protein LY79DRAFT_103451 [Colletotrichum navitas]